MSGICGAAELAASMTSEPRAAEFLVLQDGGVLTGSISRSGDRYVVTRAGGEIQVAAVNVLLVCSSLAEAYDQRRGQISRPTFDAHLALAEWCLRHNLLPQAARELIDARGFDPHHPRLKLLERRVAGASEPQRRTDTLVKPASNTHAAESVAVAKPKDTALPRDLPAGVVERFTRKVQPILVNNCTLSGCHQLGGPQTFQLDRALLHGLANRRTTMKNLAATLALVDRNRPQLSPLLTVPRLSHGGMRRPLFGPRQEAAFTHLVDWVALVTQSALAVPQTSPPAEDSTDVVVTEGPIEAAGLDGPAAPATEVAPAGFDEAALSLAEPQRLRYGAQLESWQAKDEFDPDIFNRAQRRQTKTAGDGQLDNRSSE